VKKRVLLIFTEKFSQNIIESNQLIEELKLKFELLILDSQNFPKRNIFVNKLSQVFKKILKFRFSEINSFKKHLLEKKYANIIKYNSFETVSSRFGFPFPKSQFLYNLVNKLFHKIPCYLKFPKTDLILMAGIQNEMAQCVLNKFKNKDIPIITILNSWEQLTTNGPVLNNKNIKKYLVRGNAQKDELIKFHRINENMIKIIGSLQFDLLHQIKKEHTDIKDLFKTIKEIVIFLPASDAEDGFCEPDVIMAIIEIFDSKDIKYSVVIRPYPNDKTFYDRYQKVINNKHVLINEIDDDFKTDRKNLALILKHCTFVLCGPGAIMVEAMFFRKQILFLAIENRFGFENVNIAKERYFTDHYENIIKHNSGYLVTSFIELRANIEQILIGDDIKIKGQRRVLGEQIAHLDGLAWNRAMNEIVQL